MSTKNFRGITFVLLLVAGVGAHEALAQPAGPDAPGKTGARRGPGRHKIRPVRRPGVGPLGKPEVEAQWLTRSLSLDEAQQKEVTALLETHHQRELEIREKHGLSAEEIEKWKALRDEMKKAQQAGDREKIRALRDQTRRMAEARRARTAPARELREEALQALHDGIAGVLKEDQKENFERIWQTRFTPPERRRGAGRNPRVLRSLVFQLDDLTADQRKQIDEVFKAFLEASRSAGKEAKRAEARQRQKKLFADVLAILTPEQKQKVEEQLDRRHGRRARRGGRVRFGRPAPGGEKDADTGSPEKEEG